VSVGLDSNAVLTALGRRVEAALGGLGASQDGAVAELVERLVALVAAGPKQANPIAWLAYAALSGGFPQLPQLLRLIRNVQLASPGRQVAAALDVVQPMMISPGRALRGLELLPRGRVLVDATFCATNTHNTGIQRVVRSTVPEWESAGRPIEIARWLDAGYVGVTADELSRVVDWAHAPRSVAPGDLARIDRRPLLVPWQGDLLVVEVPDQSETPELICLAQSGVARVKLIGYDTIPIGSADTQPRAESEKFAKYLSLVKRSDLVVAISHAAAEEFAGFVTALPAQGVVGPRVAAVPLAFDPPRVATRAAPEANAGLPVVLCVGSHEPRKNQDRVLRGVELLHAKGLRFRTVFVGGGSREATADFDARVRRLAHEGIEVESHRRLADTELLALYEAARFSVFVSTHEGFGLPIAESVALGTPVLTTNYGSMAEVAAAGGCLTVDPRDTDAVAGGMERLLTDDQLIATLRAEAAAVPPRSWQRYADELWGEFFRPDIEGESR
jgi:glycosyltransferase involved in cell wall biosynthesis